MEFGRVSRVLIDPLQCFLHRRYIIELQSAIGQRQSVFRGIRFQVRRFSSPIDRIPIVRRFRYSRQNSYRRNARFVELQRPARAQGRGFNITAAEIGSRPANQMTFFPPLVGMPAAPGNEYEQDDPTRNAERQLDERSLCSFDGFFQGFLKGRLGLF
jgi:hypothetical protein